MRISRFILSALFFLTCINLSYAQHVDRVELALTKQFLRGGEVSLLARQSNLALQERLGALFRPPLVANPPIYHQLPPSPKPITFQVQQTAKSKVSASAFAIQVKGTLFGVTAGHVMQNISQSPYMYFQTQENRFETAPITAWRISNIMGTDVAVFEIPPQAQKYVQPLPLADEPAQASQFASIAGFNLNEPRWLALEEILFTTPHRLLIRNNYSSPIMGLCGSPVTVNGKVVGLYVGYFPGGAPNAFLWPKLLKGFPVQQLPKLHLASPIENVLPLIHELMQYDVKNEGILMKVLGHPVAVLRPEDDLHAVALIRNGNMQKIIRAEELTDPEHLEQFLDLQENDVLRVTIFPRHLNSNHSIVRYEVNVSSGAVTQVKDNF